MKITITGIEVDTQVVYPTLVIYASITYIDNIESVLSINGRLLVNGRVVGDLRHTHVISPYEFQLNVFDNNSHKVRTNSGDKYERTFSVRLSCALDLRAILHIESYRLRHSERNVEFQLEIMINRLEVIFQPTGSTGPQNTDRFIDTQFLTFHEHYVIRHSDWINKFSAQLGLGNFLLLELQIPANRSVPGEWSELYERLALRTYEMKQAITAGDWQKAMFAARQFYENLKFDDRFAEQKQLKESLQEKFFNDQHSKPGFDAFMSGVTNFFSFISKFIHDKNNKDGTISPIPIPRQEDAFFSYALAIGLMNIIASKVNNEFQ